MPVDRLEPLGTVQKIPELQINSRIVDRANEPHYTCPVGKKAIASVDVVCTSRGAAANASLRDPTDTFDILTWSGTGTPGATGDFNIAVRESRDIVIQLQAGDIIKTTQDIGTNAEFNVIGKILELDL